MTGKISDVRRIMLKDQEYDGYFDNVGYIDIYEILDTFNETEWNDLKNDLITWKDFEHSIFSTNRFK